MTILRTVRAAQAVARPAPGHEISVSRLVGLAIEQGAVRPTDAVLRNPARFSAWEIAARCLVFAPLGITPADHDELIDACDRLAGLTPERIGAAINAAVSFIVLIVAPVAAACVL